MADAGTPTRPYDDVTAGPRQPEDDKEKVKVIEVVVVVDATDPYYPIMKADAIAEAAAWSAGADKLLRQSDARQYSSEGADVGIYQNGKPSQIQNYKEGFEFGGGGFGGGGGRSSSLGPSRGMSPTQFMRMVWRGAFGNGQMPRVVRVPPTGGVPVQLPQDDKSTNSRSIDGNRFHHIFGKAEHALDGLVSKYGSQEAAYNAVQNAANNALRAGKLTPNAQGILPSGNRGNIIMVGDMQVRLIGGRVANGKVAISTFSRKGL